MFAGQCLIVSSQHYWLWEHNPTGTKRNKLIIAEKNLVLIWDFCGFNFACTDSAPDLYLETFSFWNYWLSSRFASWPISFLVSGEWRPEYFPQNTFQTECRHVWPAWEKDFEQHIWNKECEKMPCTECMESPPVEVAQTAHNETVQNLLGHCSDMTQACSFMMTKAAAGCTFESTLTKKTESSSGEVVTPAVHRCPCA